MTNNPLPLILVSGATATGKTDLAVELALYLKDHGKNCEIINADSLLFYKELSIGTAKPTIDERKGIPHHLIDTHSITEPLNASEYSIEAEALINKLHLNNTIPLLVGGSAFYIRALLKGMYEGAQSSPEEVEKIQSELKVMEEAHGWDRLREKLKECDPLSYENIHENDRYRSLRALEYFLIHNEPISKQREIMEEIGPYDFSRLRNPQWQLHHIYLEVPKEEHWSIMEKRAQKMLKKGLLGEVASIRDKGLDFSLKPLQSIGYKESIDLIKTVPNISEVTDEQTQELAERIYINTRKLAKSQKTFFKKIKPKNSYNPLKDQVKIRENLDKFVKELSI